jgi:hypothetical protein
VPLLLALMHELLADMSGNSWSQRNSQGLVAIPMFSVLDSAMVLSPFFARSAPLFIYQTWSRYGSD